MREPGTARLEESVATYHRVLEERTREALPVAWAATQNDLGNALHTLGVREPGTARLEEAVAAFHRALEVRTRELIPFAWAITQNDLGNALQTLAVREGGWARHKEAIAAFRSAAETFEASGADYYAVMARANLGRAQWLLETKIIFDYDHWCRPHLV
jgi:tetratricopeptide (TPR) repeat protein